MRERELVRICIHNLRESTLEREGEREREREKERERERAIERERESILNLSQVSAEVLGGEKLGQSRLPGERKCRERRTQVKEMRRKQVQELMEKQSQTRLVQLNYVYDNQITFMTIKLRLWHAI